MKIARNTQKNDSQAPWLSLICSIVLHLGVVWFMKMHHDAPKPIVIEPPKVSRIRILANPNGSTSVVANKAVEISQPKAESKPQAKPKHKPKSKIKPKAKTKAKAKTRTRAIAKTVKAREEPSPASAPAPSAPQSFGDNQQMGVVGVGVSNTKGPSDPGSHSNWQPLEQIKPKMPREAALKGIEGFVSFRFDITEEGLVENLKITNAQNRSIFEAEARRAVKKFRYSPRKVNGRAVRVVGHSVTIEFKLTH